MFEFLEPLLEKIGELLCKSGHHNILYRIENNPKMGCYCGRKNCSWAKPSEDAMNQSWFFGPAVFPKPAEVNIPGVMKQEDLRMYILIHEKTPADLVPLIATHTQMLTYKKFQHQYITKGWFESPLQKTVICKVNDHQFKKAKEYGEHFALIENNNKELGELGLGFAILPAYNKFFKYLTLYKV